MRGGGLGAHRQDLAVQPVEPGLSGNREAVLNGNDERADQGAADIWKGAVHCLPIRVLISAPMEFHRTTVASISSLASPENPSGRLTIQ